MSGDDDSVRVPLGFAVLDGKDPKNWSVFGKTFPVLMEQVASVEPHAVSASALETFTVRIEPIWCSPEELLKEKRLDDIVGVIIDAWPKAKLDADLEQKKETLRRHLLKMKQHCGDGSTAKFKRFGYSVWFLTDSPRTVTPYRSDFNDVAYIIEGANFQYFTQERILFEHLAAYLSNIYNALERGK
jgi:hypothetical protein